MLSRGEEHRRVEDRRRGVRKGGVKLSRTAGTRKTDETEEWIKVRKKKKSRAFFVSSTS